MQQCVALCLFPYEDTIHECSPPCINIYMYVMVTCDELILCKDFHRFSNCFTAWCHFALQVIFIHYTVTVFCTIEYAVHVPVIFMYQ